MKVSNNFTKVLKLFHGGFQCFTKHISYQSEKIALVLLIIKLCKGKR
jgi:hypothetical protein